jgi:hypothetical protein
MRNFFKTNSGKKNAHNGSAITRKYARNGAVQEILDTDEDRVINQYSVYRNYLSRIKRELLHGGAKLIGYRRREMAQ